MKKNLFAFTLLALASGWSSEAVAVHRGAVQLQAPILQAVSVPFGLRTPALRGSVRLNSGDITTTAVHPQTFQGLDLWVGGTPCATWSEVFNAGRSSADLSLIAANTAEGVGAITPTFTSTGAANAIGNYSVSVSCKDANGNQSNSVLLTYTGVANAVNIGSTDRTDFGASPSGFGNLPGAQVLFSVGFQNPANLSLRFTAAFSNQTIVQPADPARKPYITNIGTHISGSRTTGFTLSGLMPPGTTTMTSNLGLNGVPIHDATMDNIKGFYSESLMGIAGTVGAYTSSLCSVNCGLSDSEFEYIPTGLAPGSNTTILRVSFRHFYNNCIFIGNASDVQLIDVNCFAPNISAGGLHTDDLQIADGSTPIRLTVTRMAALEADGTDQAQGPIFGGTIQHFFGYVDNGLSDHGPGIILTKTSGVFGLGSSGSRIINVAGTTNGITIANAVVMACTVTNCVQTSVTLNNLAATNIGSPGAPAEFYGTGPVDLHMDGVIATIATFHGWTSSAEAGTSYFKDFTYVQQNANPPLETTYTGFITHTTGTNGILTVVTPGVSNIATEAPYIGGRISYETPTCHYCGPSMGSLISASAVNGPGTWNISPVTADVAQQTIKNSEAFPITGGGWISQNSCTTAAFHQGTQQIGPGYGQAGYVTTFFGDICPPPNTTLVHFNGTAVTAADFASGQTPQNYLQAIAFQGNTNVEVLTKNCLAMKPKIGGLLDGGGGLWWSGVTGETDAVAHTGGGNWVTNDGHDSGIHIFGCEVAP